jgi:hypothetical protein
MLQRGLLVGWGYGRDGWGWGIHGNDKIVLKPTTSNQCFKFNQTFSVVFSQHIAHAPAPNRKKKKEEKSNLGTLVQNY